MDPAPDNAIELQQICTRFGAHVVHQGLDLAVRRGEVLGLAGGSGSGKSVLLREMIGLQRPDTGRVTVFGQDLADMNAGQGRALRQRWGVMFQRGGLFGALTVRENVGLPLREQGRRLDPALIEHMAQWKLTLTGLPSDAGLKLPSELSGGMLKRAALARAIALDPELLFLDEPTSGLDPASASEVNDLILRTQALFGPTVVIISHDVDLLWQVCDRVAMLGEGRVVATGPMETLARNPHPVVAAYFTDRRAKPAQGRGDKPRGAAATAI
jgi:phospholipid/cholesterol/gamma-HCH transport system ATP-binding protein